MKSKNKFKDKFKVWLKVGRIVWDKERSAIIWLSVVSLIYAVSILLQTVAIQYFVNECQNALQNNQDAKSIITSLFVVLAVLVGRRIFNAYFNFKLNAGINCMEGIVQLKFIEKASNAPLENFYDYNFELKKNKAEQGAETAAVFLVIGLTIIFFNMFYLAAIAIYYAFISPYMIFVVIITILPTFIIVSKNVSAYGKLEDKIAANRKEIDYYYRCLGDLEYLKETKILGCKDYFLNKINNNKTEYLNNVESHSKIILKNSVFGESVKYFSYVLIFILLIVLMNKNIISVGIFVSMLAMLNDMYSVVDDAVARDFKNLASFYPTVENYVNFIDEDFGENVSSVNIDSEIELRDVSYKYPSKEVFALENINVTIPKNKITVIVGDNGAGKSTFSKVLSGLLKPTEGDILINNEKQKNFSVKNISVLFQNFLRYPFSLRENVLISQREKETATDKVQEILSHCDIHYENKETFPNGIDTVLSKEFDGVDLSGGQWQKIALARCIHRDSDFIVLDEPTSAIDPISESDLYSLFQEMCENKTAIIVTHRLGLVSIADFVIVLEKGKIVERGTHDELISLGGKYKEMYLAQSNAYF